TIDTKNEDIAEMPELASTVTSMPAYTSKALVIDTSPIEKEISSVRWPHKLLASIMINSTSPK
ncbi:hypothetical protein ACVWCE_19920, partial [Escherichia coli]